MIRLNDQTKVSIVAGICLLGLVVVLKNVLIIPADILSRDITTYIVIYWVFTISLAKEGKQKRWFKYDTVPFWSIFIVLLTLLIIGLYAI